MHSTRRCGSTWAAEPPPPEPAACCILFGACWNYNTKGPQTAEVQYTPSLCTWYARGSYITLDARQVVPNRCCTHYTGISPTPGPRVNLHITRQKDQQPHDWNRSRRSKVRRTRYNSQLTCPETQADWREPGRLPSSSGALCITVKGWIQPGEYEKHKTNWE